VAGPFIDFAYDLSPIMMTGVCCCVLRCAELSGVLCVTGSCVVRSTPRLLLTHAANRHHPPPPIHTHANTHPSSRAVASRRAPLCRAPVRRRGRRAERDAHGRQARARPARRGGRGAAAVQHQGTPQVRAVGVGCAGCERWVLQSREGHQSPISTACCSLVPPFNHNTALPATAARAPAWRAAPWT
jgi:hypothetical protein